MKHPQEKQQNGSVASAERDERSFQTTHVMCVTFSGVTKYMFSSRAQ